TPTPTRAGRQHDAPIHASPYHARRGVELLRGVGRLLAEAYAPPVRPPPSVPHVSGQPAVTVVGERLALDLVQSELAGPGELHDVRPHVPGDRLRVLTAGHRMDHQPVGEPLGPVHH